MSDKASLITVLDQLAHAAAEAPDTRWTTTVLAAAVLDLECAAGASLGVAECDPLVVLQRRIGRVHRLLATAPGATNPERVQAHLRALRHPAPAPRGALVRGPAAVALVQACAQ